MGNNLPPATLIDFIVGDFEDAWEALAHVPGSPHRGNFMFGRQAMTLLEVACRLCYSDSAGNALRDLSAELAKRDPRYFTTLPGVCWQPKGPAEFLLPYMGPNPESQLIAGLFDLIRNGQAHQYQQISVQLIDGKQFYVALTGAEHGISLKTAFQSGRPADHLGLRREANGDLCLKARTDILFLDIRDSLVASNLLSRGLSLTYLSRGIGSRSSTYAFTSTNLEQALRKGGH